MSLRVCGLSSSGTSRTLRSMGRFISIFFLVIPFFAIAEEQQEYEGAHACLRTLTTEYKSPFAAVFLNPKGVAIAHNNFGGRDGFIIMAPKSAFFIERGEVSKSAEGSGSDEKLTVRFGDSSEDPIKFYFKAGATNESDQITFGAANEFDRVVAAEPLPISSAKETLQVAIDRSFRGAEGLAQNQKAKLKKILKSCQTAGLDFKLVTPQGESTFQAEIHRLQDKMKPGMFSKEYWFGAKDGGSF